ncbi:E3 ubiquitin-protein ligase UBR2 [Portunus trituberculatus]|uniref:E3 ubiquitin-protein ligase n=1 Tax=Portunus trituberculatus TaxID=210409 RepID=A0A5B7DSU0_PORTR|nr:E3 ubiquitin-protein ligase UBR2 [Portunus trituberculatus]
MNRYTCILCHQEDRLCHSEGIRGRPMVLGALIQRSTVLSRNRSRHLDQPETHDTLILPGDLHWGAHTSSCGHAMHANCWQKYFDDVVTKERRRPYRYRQNMSFDIEKSEFLCPLCEALCNTALPLLPGVTWSSFGLQDQPPPPTLSLPDWLRGLHIILKYKTVMVNGARPTEEGGHSDDTQMDTSPQPTGMVAGHGTVGGMAAATSVGAGGSAASIPMGGLPGRGRGSTNTGITTFMKAVPGDGGQRSGEGKDEEEDSASSNDGEGMWTPPSLPEVASELAAATSSDSAEAFTALFNSPAATSVPDFPTQTLEMMSNFSHSVYMHGLHVNPNLFSRRIPLMVWNSTAYTIHTLEETQRNSNRALLTSLSSRQRDCLAPLVKFAAYAPLCVKRKQTIEGVAVRLLSLLLEGGESTPCVLEWDVFSILVTLTLSLPSIFPSIQGVATGSQQDLHILQVCFLAHIVQLLLTCEEPEADVDMEVDEGSDKSSEAGDGPWLVSMMAHCRSLANIPQIKVQPQQLLDYSYCCQTEFPEGSRQMVGACTYHAHFCGAGTGIFIRVRECKILLLSGQIKGCFVNPPYLDGYGETDQGLKRGNPLHLDATQYSKLHAMWLSHSIPDTIAHTMESNSSVKATSI